MIDQEVDKIFKALADTKRRKILQMLVVGSAALNINAISDQFDISRQAITRHIKTLEEAGLVVIKQEGRENLCYPNAEKLYLVYQWVDQYSQLWKDKLDDLGTFLDQQSSEKNS